MTTNNANTVAMRRFALAAVFLTNASPLWAQAPIQQVPRTGSETATANGPIPAAQVQEQPSKPNPAGSPKVSSQEKEPILPIRPASRDVDQLTGHVRIGAALAYGTFSGSFRSDASIGSNFGGSTFIHGDLGVGLSRHLELLVVGDYSDAAAGSGCSADATAGSVSGSCDAKSWSLGPGLRYHLVEGTRFSPWLAIGVAYRQNDIHFPFPSRSLTVKSVDVLRLTLGGDWYATSLLTLGPILGFGIASSYAAPTHTDNTTFAWIYGGVRILLDLPGR